MKQRCLNPRACDYARYGGRGITVCDEWQADFRVFARWALSSGYHDDLQIDRTSNDGNYTPSNCRFVTPRENSSNKRNSNQATGVRWDKKRSKWEAQIGYKGRSYYLGLYHDTEIAAFAYEFALAGILGLED